MRPPLLAPKLPGPRIDRSVHLNFCGDWGQANLHTVCCWLGHELVFRAGAETRYAIWNGRGGMDGIRAAGTGEADISLVTPAVAARMAFKGLGPFRERPMSHLRALGVVPQNDRLILAVRKELCVRSFSDIRENKVPLKIATGPDDGENLIGFAVRRLMEASGVSRVELESWGGGYLESEMPQMATQAVVEGQANAIFHEAVMAHFWHDLVSSTPLNFVPLEMQALKHMKVQFDWPAAVLKANHFGGQSEPIAALEFSDFIVLCTTDLPEDIAYLLTWALCNTQQALERRYRHIKPERSPVSYPLVPQNIARSPIPLHDGSLRYYEEANIQTPKFQQALEDEFAVENI